MRKLVSLLPIVVVVCGCGGGGQYTFTPVKTVPVNPAEPTQQPSPTPQPQPQPTWTEIDVSSQDASISLSMIKGEQREIHITTGARETPSVAIVKTTDAVSLAKGSVGAGAEDWRRWVVLGQSKGQSIVVMTLTYGNEFRVITLNCTVF